MTGEPFSFRAVSPRPWTGRYRRVPGDATPFHLQHVDGRWRTVAYSKRGVETGTCVMVDEGDAALLADAVNAGKAVGWSAGGAFLIDEHGRVLVPSSNADVFVVGECTGRLRFTDPFAPGAQFDLYDDTDLASGDLWERPYVGVQYQLSRYNELYFWDVDTAGAGKQRPPFQDGALIQALRGARGQPHGPARFLVGFGGVVITKRPPLWEPCYVGRLDLECWFPRETL